MNLSKYSCLVLSLFALASNLSACDSLWEQTEVNVKSSRIWLPGTVETHQIVSNGKGETEAENLILFEITRNPATGEPQGVLKQLMEGDKDRTEKSRDELEAQLQAELEANEMDFPFHLDNPSDSISSRSEHTKEFDCVDCVGYKFEVDTYDPVEDETLRFAGIVWVDPVAAIPLAVEGHLMGVPIKQDGAEIVSLVVNRRYGLQNGALIQTSETQQIWINARFLFKKIVVFIDSQTSCSDHWLWK